MGSNWVPFCALFMKTYHNLQYRLSPVHVHLPTFNMSNKRLRHVGQKKLTSLNHLVSLSSVLFISLAFYVYPIIVKKFTSSTVIVYSGIVYQHIFISGNVNGCSECYAYHH